MRWLAWPVIGIAVALLALGGPRGAAADPVAELAAVGPAAPQAIGPGFTVDFDVNTDDATFQGYAVYVDYNPLVVNADLWTWLMPAGMGMCGTTLINNGVGNAQDNGCANPYNPVGAFTGTVSTLDMHCVAPGVSQLDLRSLAEVGPFGSSLFAAYGLPVIPTTLIDGYVTCGGGGVGGIAELPLGERGSSPLAPSGDGLSAGQYAAMVAGALGAVVALGAGGWYARRRWLR
jgi:hypothetical protein